MESPFISQTSQRKLTKRVILTAFLAVFAIAAVLAVYEIRLESTNLPGGAENASRDWKEWKKSKKKNYGSAEEASRFSVFTEKNNKIKKHNQEPHDFEMGLNEYSDLSSEEWSALLTGLHIPTDVSHAPSDSFEAESAATTTLPVSVDWRLKGYVNAIKNQGMCGSCWAFAATAAMEGLAKAKTGKLPILSNQQLVDCSRGAKYGNLGCNGGWSQSGFQYAIDKGMASDTAYPYTGKTGTCKSFTSIFKPKGFIQVTPKSNYALKSALQKGPVVAYIEADEATFQQYKSGTYNDAGCWKTKAIDHAVVVVGYTSTAWIVRNSWGTTWGDKGYIYISQTSSKTGGICGIVSDSNAYPTA